MKNLNDVVAMVQEIAGIEIKENQKVKVKYQCDKSDFETLEFIYNNSSNTYFNVLILSNDGEEFEQTQISQDENFTDLTCFSCYDGTEETVFYNNLDEWLADTICNLNMVKDCINYYKNKRVTLM